MIWKYCDNNYNTLYQTIRCHKKGL